MNIMDKINKLSASIFYRELKTVNKKYVNLNLDFYLKLVLVNKIINEDNMDINSILQKSDYKELLLILKYAISEFPVHIQKLFQLNEPDSLNEFEILKQLGFPVTILKFRLNRINLEIHESLLT